MKFFITSIAYFFFVSSLLAQRTTSTHPRLFLTPEIIVNLQSRATNNTPEWQLLKGRTQTGLTVTQLLNEYQGYHYAYSYTLSFIATNNTAHRDIAVQLFKGVFNNDTKDSDMCDDVGFYSRSEILEMSLLYDWLYPHLDEPFRAAVRTRLVKWADIILGVNKSTCRADYVPYGIWQTAGYNGEYFFEGNNYTIGHLLGIASVAYSIYTEDKASADRLLVEVDKILPLMIAFANTRLKYGDANEGWSYGAGYALNFFRLLALIKTASSNHRDYFLETTYDEDAIRFLTHATLPSRDHMLPEGDWARESTGKIWEYHRFAAEIISSYSDSQEARGVARFWANEAVPLNQFEVTAYRYQSFLTANQEIAPLDYKALPSYSTKTHFTTEQGTGQFLQRSGWDTNDQWVSFKASPRYGDHAHNGPGHFSIYENGWLIVDRNILTRSGIEGADSLQNCIHFQGMNANQYYQNSQHSIFKRTEFVPDYSYLWVNTTPEYTIRQKNIVKKSERQFLYLPGVKSIVLFDVAETNTASQFKSFGVNFYEKPTIASPSLITYSNATTKVNVQTAYPISTKQITNDVLVRIDNTEANTKDYYVNLIYTQPKNEAPRSTTSLCSENSSILYSKARGTQFIAGAKSYAVLFTSDDAIANGTDSLTYTVPIASITQNYVAGMTPNTNYYMSWGAYISQHSNNGFRTRISLSVKNYRDAVIVRSSAAGLLSFEVRLDNITTGLNETSPMVHSYPNPATDQLVIDTAGKEIDDIQLISLDGIVTKPPYKLVPEGIELNLLGLSNGLYVIKGSVQGHYFVRKFIKQSN